MAVGNGKVELPVSERVKRASRLEGPRAGWGRGGHRRVIQREDGCAGENGSRPERRMPPAIDAVAARSFVPGDRPGWVRVPAVLSRWVPVWRCDERPVHVRHIAGFLITWGRGDRRAV